MQDFLPKSQTLGSAAAPDTDLPDFPDQFRRLFAHLKVNKALSWHIKHHPQGQGVPISDSVAFSDLKKYNWSRVQVRLLMSVAGTYTGFKDMSEYGICRLGKILADEGWQPRKDEKVVAEYQVSSSLCSELTAGLIAGAVQPRLVQLLLPAVQWEGVAEHLSRREGTRMAATEDHLPEPGDCGRKHQPAAGKWILLTLLIGRAAVRCSAARRTRTAPRRSSMTPTRSVAGC